MNKQRLDLYLYNKNICESRNKIQEIIKNNHVLVNGKIINKTNYMVDDNDFITIKENLLYVSRAGYKLKAAIDKFKIDINNKYVLDIGASTGGFSDCCIQNGAEIVYCLDVGKNQLHDSIKNNDRVIDLSPLNIKELNQNLINHQIDLIVSDLSFISSKYMFEAIKNIDCSEDLKIVSLIKPQFELDKKIVNKTNGIIKEKKYHDLAITRVIEYAKNNGFKNIGIIDSPIYGGKGNKEFLGLFVYDKK